jgi:capsular polysaccharide biosynthesis protein
VVVFILLGCEGGSQEASCVTVEFGSFLVRSLKTDSFSGGKTMFRKFAMATVAIVVPFAAVVGLSVWLSIGNKFTAYAIIYIAAGNATVLGREVGTTDMNAYNLYRGTQEQKLLSRTVLVRALRNRPDLDAYVRGDDDPCDWLSNHLSVTFPEKSELMVVSLRLANPEAAVALVNAVVDSYKAEVVDFEAERKRVRFSQVDKACIDKEQDIRNKRQELKNLVTDVGTVDAATMRERMLDREMLQAEIKDLEIVLGRMTQEREDLRVELNASPRITIYQRADPAREAAEPVALKTLLFAVWSVFTAGFVYFVLHRRTRTAIFPCKSFGGKAYAASLGCVAVLSLVGDAILWMCIADL